MNLTSDLHIATIDDLPPVRQRPLEGISAVLLPVCSGEVDWSGLRLLMERTWDCGLLPAVNMDTGYANLISEPVRQRVLELAREIGGGRRFVAGAFVGDQPGAAWNLAAYQRAMDDIQRAGGLPIIFQSYGLVELPDPDLVQAYGKLGAAGDGFLFFELGQMFAGFGRIYSESTFAELLRIPQALGAKHSSLNRLLEWERLKIRDRLRPEFRLYTGNDLAIDMVMYGSDYLLGLSALAPEAFAQRDRWWANGDPRFFELNDWLQYLGQFCFRAPTSAYKHDIAMFLKLRGVLRSDEPFPGGMQRPDSDRQILQEILAGFRQRWPDLV